MSNILSILNPDAPRRERLCLALNTAGRYVVEPLDQQRGCYSSIVADIYLRDIYGEYPQEIKTALRAAIAKAEEQS